MPGTLDLDKTVSVIRGQAFYNHSRLVSKVCVMAVWRQVLVERKPDTWLIVKVAHGVNPI